MWKRNCGINVKSQNIQCAEAKIPVTEYFAYGISLVPYAIARMTRERRGHMPHGSKPSWRCCYLLFQLGDGLLGFFVCFLHYYQAVTNQLTYDKDPDISVDKHHGRRPLELSYLQGQHANPKESS